MSMADIAALGWWKGSFDRFARPSQTRATVCGGRLMSMADIAARTGRTREGVRLLTAGARGPGGFPPPVTDPRSRYRLWRWSEVERWLSTYLGKEVGTFDDDVLTAINAGLELRRHRRRLHPGRQAMLRELVGLQLSGNPVPNPSADTGIDACRSSRACSTVLRREEASHDDPRAGVERHVCR